MNYLVQFHPTTQNHYFRFLAEDNRITVKLTEALIFSTATAAGKVLDNYREITGDFVSNIIIRPTGL